MSSKNVPPRIFVALDVDSLAEAESLAQELGGDPRVGFKIGPRLVLRYGAEVIRSIARSGSLFIDMKFFDIPTTMVSAVDACFAQGADYVTVHALAGPEALTALQSVESTVRARREHARILAVTILTSWTSESASALLKRELVDLEASVATLVAEVSQSGLTGIVCSPRETARVRKQLNHSFIVNPGIRWDANAAGDQKRTASAEEAFRCGADSVVVGRPILQAQNRKAVLQQLLDQIPAPNR